ncbi:MAG: dihydroneopterin aldolase [Muribaculaceae bacterium]|nr:dihydroneopterin aldolase [Muribaculaceae bacterium]
MTSAIIEINRLKVYAYHGVDPQEAVVGNDFEVSVKLEYPCEHAMQTDKLESTLSYADVIEVVVREMRRPSKLLENVVYRIHSSLMYRFPRVISGSVTVCKIHPPLKYQMESCGFTYKW